MKPQSLLAGPGLMMVALLGLPWPLAAAAAARPGSGPTASAAASATQDSPAAASQAVEGFINVPVAEAWRLFTTPAGYQVAGVGNAEVDLRIGGTIRTVYRLPFQSGSVGQTGSAGPASGLAGGTDLASSSTSRASNAASPRANSGQDSAGPAEGRQTVLSEILAYEPERMLATRLRQPAANFVYRDAIAGTWSVMYFTASGPDMTQVRIVSLGYSDAAQSQALRKFLADGNRALLDQIARHYWPKCKLCGPESGESK